MANQMQNSILELLSRDGISKSILVLLGDACFIKYSVSYSAIGNQPVKEYFTISPAYLKHNGALMFAKTWKKTNLTNTAKPTKVHQDKGVQIIQPNWQNKKSEIIEETTYGEQISLVAAIDNHEGGTAKITIEKQDGTAFENGEKQLSFEEPVNEDGKIELSSLEIKEQWEEFKTAEVDSLVATVEYLGATKKSKALQLKTFDVKIKLLKESKTIVPMGIPTFSGAKENKFIEFEVEILEKDIGNFDLEILKDDKIIYSQSYGEQTLEEVVIIGKSSKNKKNSQNEQETENQEEKSVKKCKVGNYRFKWDGFIQGKYDSTLFLEGEFKARIKGYLNQVEKTAETKTFSFKRKKKDWVDVKIDETAKRIDVTLRVNLRDGGEKGTEKYCKVGRNRAQQIKTCPWDDIPEGLIKDSLQEPIKTRTKTFQELRKMALEGVATYWSRTFKRTKGTEIDGVNYEINVKAIQDKKGMKAPKIIYFTNSKETNFTRSHNWEVSRKLFYIVGYTLRDGIWDFRYEKYTNPDFIETTAHEIGHEILLAYGGQLYSKKHKGTSTIMQNVTNKKVYPKSGEIDLMKYYKGHYPNDFYERRVTSKKDILSLIWLTKMKLK
ncbi:MAG: hypothetical protein L3J23_05470 [Flavobacteriaceae bacterium]|nr:hypothetical protein [Flavobacteriaceae bacterium]